MGAISVIVGAFIMLIFLLIFMQPVILLLDQATATFAEKNTTMYGTDSDGNVVPVGDSLFGMDITLGLIAFLGLAMLIGFIIWAARGGIGGAYDPAPQEEIRRGEF